MDKLDSKKIIYPLLLLALLPLFFTNINTFHNWGDDFAQYLCQARNIVDGTTFNETPIFDIQNSSPINRGSGFSLLLSPIYLFFQLSIAPYLIFISLCLVILGFVLFKFYNQVLTVNQKALISIFLVLIFVYNRHVLFLKTEILTVFPYMILLYLVFILNHQNTPRSILKISGLVGLIISIANTGWILYLTLLLFSLGTFIQNSHKQNFKNLCIQLLVPIFLYGCIKFIVFKTLFTDDISWYQPLFSIEKILPSIYNNAVYYKDIFFLNFDQDIWFGFNKSIKFFMVVTTSFGFFNRLTKRLSICEVFFLLYFILLLIYPDKASGLRFLMPLLPLILYYSVLGNIIILDKLKLKTELFLFIFYAGILLSYLQNLQSTIHQYGNETEGPHQKESIEAFKFIKDSTNKNSRIAFFKPWALKLYTERASMPISVNQNLQQIKTKMRENRVEYILLNLKKVPDEMYHKTVISQITEDGDFEVLQINEYFNLYHLLQKKLK